MSNPKTEIIREPREWADYCAKAKERSSVGFVPTMGALHEGHASLFARASKENTTSLASVFVNPTQFNDPKDLDAYPRVENSDIEILSREGVAAVFMPSYTGIYPDGYRYRVIEGELSKLYCGAFRPGHFDGVLSIVLKLLNLTRADRAYFGEKDYQQYMLVRGLAHAFFVDTEIVPCPIVREPNGLAMSSRNERLDPLSREKAGALYNAISKAKSASEAKTLLESSGMETEYIEDIYDTDRSMRRRLAAVRYGGVRLIDNVEIQGDAAQGRER